MDAALPSLGRLRGEIKAMDDAEAERYMFGDGGETDLAPWQPSDDADVADLVALVARTAAEEMDAGGVLMDVGCGDGRALLFAAKTRSWSVLGWDKSPLCISVAEKLRAEERIPNATFAVVDASDAACIGPSHLSSTTGVAACSVYLLPKGLQRVLPTLRAIASLQPTKSLIVITNRYHYPSDQHQALATQGELRAFRLVVSGPTPAAHPPAP